MSLDDIIFPPVERWPTWARRAFLLTLPVSGPLLVPWTFAALMVAALVLCVFGMIVLPIVGAVSAWIRFREWAAPLWRAHPSKGGRP